MKKIIAFSLAVVVLISFFAVCFSVSADNETVMTNQEYYAAQAYLVAKYKDGKISYSEFQEQSQAVTDEFVSKNTVGGVLQSGALNASNTFNAVSQKIGNTVQKYGESAREYINDYVSDFFNDYIVLSDKPTIDLNGSGALAVVIGENNLYRHELKIYGDYGVIDPNIGTGPLAAYQKINLCSNDVPVCYVVDHITYKEDGTFFRDNYYFYDNRISSTRGKIAFLVDYIVSIQYYGDWKSLDDTPVETDDIFETISDYDFSEAPERELEDLLNKILDEFELQQPDLSSIEGLLNAIYARLGTLDSDNDNALLASINAAILALVKSNNDNNEALLNELVGFREDLKNGTVGTGSAAHGHEISGTLYNVIPLDKNWLNKIFHDKANLKVQYEDKTYYLEDCGCLKLDDKYYNVDINYSSQIDVDYDFGFDVSELNFLIRDNQKFYDVDFGNLKDLIPKSSSEQPQKMKRSTIVEDKYGSSFYDILTDSQGEKVDIITDMVSDFVSVGVPFNEIKENFSTFETILFKKNYTPKDIVINYSFGHSYMSFTILSYNWFNGGSSDNTHGGGDGNFGGGSTEHEGSSGDTHGGGGGSFGGGSTEHTNSDGDTIVDVSPGYSDSRTEIFSKYVKIVRAFTSILISFSWLISMYKKASSLI